MGGTENVTFSVAVNNSYRKQDGTKVEQTEWYSVISSQSSLLPYLKKGTQVLVQGNLKVKVFQSEKDRLHYAGLNISNPLVQLLSARKEDGQSEGNSQDHPASIASAGKPVAAGVEMDEPPF